MAPLELEHRLARFAAEQPDAPAVIGQTGSVSFAELDNRSHQVAAGLCAAGLHAGDRLALRFSNDHAAEYAVAYLAGLRVGCTLTSIAPTTPLAYLQRVILDAQAALLVSAEDWTDYDLGCATRSIGTLYQPEARYLPPRLALDSVAEIVYTSGTTGSPKGVAVTRACLDSELAADDALDGARRRILHALTPGSNFALATLRGAIAIGATNIALTSSHPDQLLSAADRFLATDLFLVPAMASMIMLSPNAARFDVSSVERVVLSSAPVAPALLAHLATLFNNARLFNSYTSTEAWPNGTVMEYRVDKDGSVGKPASAGAVAILSPQGRELPPGSTGRVALRCGTLPRRSYWRASAPADVEAPTHSVWTGDLGYLDHDGYLFLVGRTDDIVNVGGQNVSAVGMEALLLEHPSVGEAAVIGHDDEVLGQRIVAYVVTRCDADPGAIMDFATRRLSPSERITDLRILPALPHNPNGKVDKQALRKHPQPDAQDSPDSARVPVADRTQT